MKCMVFMRCAIRSVCGFDVFFFQAEDGIRDWSVTGVQTCALPICRRFLGHLTQDRLRKNLREMPKEAAAYQRYLQKFDDQETEIEKLQKQVKDLQDEIGRASCRERE